MERNSSARLSSSSGDHVRVKIPNEFRIDPPVKLLHSNLNVESPTSSIKIDLELEKSILNNPRSFTAKDFLKEFKPHSELDSSTQKNSGRIATSLGAAYARMMGASEDEARRFSNNLKQLTVDLGFDITLAADALARLNNNFDLATDACISYVNHPARGQPPRV
mmetsp:Transcript_10338/g.19071  ORF Transcript_10338/g.19071 Transcript_10338/m.19071 type:complete len:164 (-) Transcript_10338:444-935(-)